VPGAGAKFETELAVASPSWVVSGAGLSGSGG